MNAKGIYKSFTEQYKITPRKALSSLSKQSYKHLVEVADPKIFKACIYRGKIARKPQGYLIDRWIENREIISTAYKDNQKTIIPLCMKLNCTPKQLKDMVGRANWKKLLRNSITRNNILADMVAFKGGKWDNIDNIIDLPPTYLKYSYRDSWYSHEVLSIGAKLAVAGRYISKDGKCYNVCSMIHDTINMFDYLGEKYNPDWSENRWREEHDKASEKITSRKHSKTPFVYSTELIKFYEDDKFTATLLDSPFAVAKEGSEMGHCVASYSDACSEGKYCVYSIVEKETQIRSTIGIHITPWSEGVMVYRKQQHYRRHNKSINDEEASFGLLLVDRLNIECGMGTPAPAENLHKAFWIVDEGQANILNL